MPVHAGYHFRYGDIVLIEKLAAKVPSWYHHELGLQHRLVTIDIVPFVFKNLSLHCSVISCEPTKRIIDVNVRLGTEVKVGALVGRIGQVGPALASFFKTCSTVVVVVLTHAKP